LTSYANVFVFVFFVECTFAKEFASIEDDAKNIAIHEKSLVEEIKSLKSQLAAKKKERIETVEALHNMESRCISVGAKLEAKIEDCDNLKKDLKKVLREKNYLEKKIS
jgi:septal ring factor EnvC (AmiA/AmiB activator)